MTAAAFLTILSHWRRHPLQLLMLAAGLALATGLWSAVQAINGEARASYALAEQQLGLAGTARLEAESGTIPLQQYAALRRAGWALAPVLEGRIRFDGQTFDLMGVDLLNHPLVATMAAAAEDSGTTPVDALRPPGSLFAHPQTAELAARTQSTYPVLDTEALPQGVLIADLSLASLLLQQAKRIELSACP